MLKTAFLLLAVAATASGFAPPSSLALRSRPTTGLRRSSATSVKALVELPTPVYTAATSILLAYDSDGSKTDSLYNGIPADGTVNAPVWLLPVAALSVGLFVALIVPLVLKPGADAFEKQRNDIGVFSDKGSKEDQFK